MKILLAVTDTATGGVTTAAVNFSNELVRRGHEVVFLDMSGANGVSDRLDKSIKLGSLSDRSRYWRLVTADLRRARGVKKLFLAALGVIKKLTIKSGLWDRLVFKKYKEFGEFDIAIAYRQCAPCYSFVLNKVKAKKKLGFVHGELNYMGDISSWQRFMPHFYKVCYVSEAVRDQFVAKYPELSKNAAVVYNVVDEEKIKNLAQEKPDIEFDENVINFVTVSRLENGIKGTERIPEIAEKLKKKGKDFRWYIVGDGPDRENCEKSVFEKGLSENVIFVGKKDNPFCYLAAADASVSVSRSESFGLSVLESLVCGTPVIAGEYDAIHSLIKNKENGIIAKNTIEDIFVSMCLFLKDLETRQKLVCETQKYNYDNERVYAQFIGATCLEKANEEEQ